MNNVVLVGRLTSDPKKLEVKEGNCYFAVAVNRNYKNDNGIYETDFISCCVCEEIAKKMAETVKKGDIVGVKGRLENVKNSSSLIVIVDKLGFVTSNNKEV